MTNTIAVATPMRGVALRTILRAIRVTMSRSTMSDSHFLAQDARAGSWRAALLCALAVAVFASWIATRSTLWDRDEPRFAEAAVEMVHSGQYLYPTFNGELRADKPILIYWLMASTVRLFGESEWAVRAWAPVGLAVAAWLTYRIGRRFLPASTALLASLVLASAPLAVVEGTIATTDGVLLACITAAMAVFAAMLDEGWRAWHFAALALALGLAQLVKGPVGLALPILAILGARWMLRGTQPLARGFGLRLAYSALASILLFVAWAAPANFATDGRFAAKGLGHHVADRMVHPLEGHGGNYALGLLFYLPVLAIGFAPWMLQLPAALGALWGGRLGDRKLRALLIAWIVIPFALMSLVATKLPHYILPIFPALALAVAAVVDAAERGQLDPRDRRRLSHGAWLYGGVLVIEVGALIAAAVNPPAAELRAACLAVAAVLLVQGAIALRLHMRGRWRHAALATMAGSFAMWLVLGVYALPRIENIKLAPRLASAIRAATPPTVPIATASFDEPSLLFYAGRAPIEHLESESALTAWLQEPAPGVLVIPRSQLAEIEKLRAGLERIDILELAAVHGFNYSKGKVVELVALRRGSGPP